MEKNHKNTDCYFFYYSTCTKGDNCAYRHESSALGSETVCSYWLEGSCLDLHCNYRHMEIKKNRKSIPCYWEKFPTGCKKPHCPFFHRMTRTAIANPIEPVKTATTPVKPVNQEWSNRPDGKFEGNSAETEQGRGNSEAGSFINSPVDPLIVNFEEESDSESAPSPTKNPRTRISSCKTYEEIRLEEIQAESAAFYFYEPSTDYQGSTGGGKEKKVTSTRSQRIAVGASIYGREKIDRRDSDELDFQVLSLEEIRRRKRNSNPPNASPNTLDSVPEPIPQDVKEHDFLKHAIKVLDELRAVNSEIEVEKASERRKKRSFLEVKSEESTKRARSKPEPAKVPPVRLKRTRRSSPFKDEDRLADSQEESERLEDGDGSCSGRREAVEVRLCDSSTDDSASTEIVHEKSKGVAENTDAVLKNSSSEGGALLLGKEDLHSLDTASDDILKDIDALLTDDPNS